MRNKYEGKKAYYNEIASGYESARIGQEIWKREDQWLETYLEKLDKDLCVLDIPVGTGRFLPFYAKRDFQITGIDISAEMLTIAKSKGVANVQLFCGDAESLNLEDNSIDYVICFRLFHLLPIDSIAKVLKEFARITRKEIVIEVFDTSLATAETQPPRNSIRNLMRALVRRNTKDRSNDNTNSNNGAPWQHIENFSYTQQQLEIKIREAGLKLKKLEKIEDTENPATVFILTK